MKTDGRSAGEQYKVRAALEEAVRRLSFLPITKRADLPAFRLYDLRHTVATLLLAAEVNVKW